MSAQQKRFIRINHICKLRYAANHNRDTDICNGRILLDANRIDYIAEAVTFGHNSLLIRMGETEFYICFDYTPEAIHEMQRVLDYFDTR